MDLAQRQRDHRYLLARAGELLGRPVRAVYFTWDAQRRIRKRLSRGEQIGLDTPWPLTVLGRPQPEADLSIGMQRFRLRCRERPIELVRVKAVCKYQYDPRYDFWAVAAEDYETLRQFVTRRRGRQRGQEPILADQVRAQIWDNTVGFLRKSVPLLARYGIVQKRGVLLLGCPGNGKTMAARWLRSACRLHKLRWRSVTAEEYRSACEDNELRRLFYLPRPGIVQFDDLDAHLCDRDRVGRTSEHTALLTELDGLEPRHGVVYLFCSNVSLEQIDPAIRRPGRIDQIIHLPKPTAELRRRLITETWHADLAAALDIEQAVRETAGLSFAELEEIKRMLVLRFVDSERWDWDAARDAYRAGRGRASGKPIGFHHVSGAAQTMGAAAASPTPSEAFRADDRSC